MSLVDLSGAIDVNKSGTYTVTRYDGTEYDGGRELEPGTSTLEITASVQPATGQDLKRLPEGQRDEEALMLFTAVELRGGSGGRRPDTVLIDGGTFQVANVQRWQPLGNFYEVLLTRQAGT